MSWTTGQVSGGYPPMAIDGALPVVGNNIVDLIKANEIAIGKISVGDSFKLLTVSVTNEGEESTWVKFDDGAEIKISAGASWEESRDSIHSIKFLVSVPYNIRYTY